MVYSNNFAVAIKQGGQVLREHGEEVYLPFGSEYSILLKNLNSKKALACISIDGEDVMEGSGLIINANTSIDLKRFILGGDMNKGPTFKFIEKTSEIERHRGNRVDDGIVRVEYQFKKDINYAWTYTGPVTNTNTEWCPYDRNIKHGISSGNSVQHTFDEVTCYNATMSSTPTNNDAGITVKGQDVHQGFRHEDIGELESVKYTICLKLVGRQHNHTVTKPVTVKTKINCEVCGRKNTSRNKFCYNCGNNLTW